MNWWQAWFNTPLLLSKLGLIYQKRGPKWYLVSFWFFFDPFLVKHAPKAGTLSKMVAWKQCLQLAQVGRSVWSFEKSHPCGSSLAQKARCSRACKILAGSELWAGTLEGSQLGRGWRHSEVASVPGTIQRIGASGSHGTILVKTPTDIARLRGHEQCQFALFQNRFGMIWINVFSWVLTR